MKLSVSNIAWAPEADESVYRRMQALGFTGLEIAPTRIFPENPYDRTPEAAAFAADLRARYGFTVSSMQSIWYGRTEQVFGTPAERAQLTAYTKKAVDFAAALGCRNLVFGCPRSRVLPAGADPVAAIPFFRELGEYAAGRGTVIAMEANPPMYGTNYINTTAEALSLIREVGSAGFRLNLDIGTMIANGEDLSVLRGAEQQIHHMHLSEPGLVPVSRRSLHRELADFLRSFGYGGFVSVEAARPKDPAALEEMLAYAAEIFGNPTEAIKNAT